MTKRILAALGAVLPVIFAASPNFLPDVIFKGSTLTGWHKLGDAEWRAENGDIIATPKSPGGGWLVLDKGLQDVAVYTSFQCSAECKTGVLLRAERTSDGMKGVFVSLSTGDVAPYDLVLDARGAEVSRTRLTPGPGPMTRSSSGRVQGDERVPGFAQLVQTPAERAAAAAAAAAKPPAQAGNAGGGRGGRGGAGGPALRAGEWNTVQIILDSDVLSVQLNGRGGGVSGTTNDRMMSFGSIALYAGGTGEVRFKEVSYKDLNRKFEPKETVSSRFEMQRLNDFYYGWCATAADFNHDGINDVAAGPFIFLGPDYTERHEFTASRAYNPSTQFTNAMVNFAYDFTGDGWPDILLVDQRPIYLFVNPKGESRRWDRYSVVPNSSTEINLLKDIDGDGKPEVLFGGGGAMAFAKPDPANPTAPWIVTQVSERGNVNAHGMGVGDINGDGRMDVVNSRGWWAQPPKGEKRESWQFFPASFGSGGAEMGVYDVNGDGLNDVVTALSAHTWGLAWFEQKRDAAGAISWVQHMIMGDYSTKNAGDVTFSQPHAATFADIDGDGVLDFLVGKRQWSHLESYTDPDPYGPAVLYAYRTVRNKKAEGGAEFVPELIHNRSGVGSHFAAVDVNKDGAIDILTSTARGTFIFWGKPRARK